MPVATRSREPSDTSPPRVVVVDDHPAVLAALCEYLEDAGFALAGSAGNGREAIDLCVREQPDAVVMDVRMPVLGGIEAAAELRALQPPLAILLISAYEHEELLEAGRRAGADAFLRKGIAGAALAAELNAAIASRRA